MRNVRGLVTLLATLGALVGGLVFAAVPALAAAPQVLREEVSGITPYNARLEAVANAGNETTECRFQYGRATVSEHEVPCEQGEQGTLEGEENYAGTLISSLQPDTTYYYRLVVKNAAGEASGSEDQFTTLAAVKPVVESESASENTVSSVNLNATLDPDYQPTSCAFEYRKQGEVFIAPEEFRSPVGCEQGGTVEGGVQNVSAVLGGLESESVYEYRLIAENGSGTTDGPIETFTTVLAPVVVTGAAQDITDTSATLAGAINPGSGATSYYFEYMSQSAYERALAGDPGEKVDPYGDAETTTALGVSASSEAQSVGPVSIRGLLPGTTYNYVLVAINDANKTVGAPMSFTTLPGTPPLASTGGASGVSQNAATLSGTVTTNSLQTNYGFEIGTAPDSYGPTTGLGSIGGSLSEEVHVTLSELQPGTSYYYRITATNADGTVQGQPGSFTTPGFPTLISPPASPPLITTPNIAFPKEEKTTTTTTKKLTNAEKLKKALKACKREKKKPKRAACEKTAHKKYKVAKKKRK